MIDRIELLEEVLVDQGLQLALLLETDIRMGVESGMKTALVMTGVTDRKTLEASPLRPDYVLQSIADLESLLR